MDFRTINDIYSNIYNKTTPIIETKPAPNPSLFYELKKSVGLEKYSDTSFILYFFLFYFSVQKMTELYSFIKGLIFLPKQVSDAYNFITKEDLILTQRLEDLMHQLMGITNADRIAIAKIHNGTYDNTGGHQMKFSIIYEITNRLAETKDQVQNIPVDYIKDEIILGSLTDYQRVDRSDLDSLCDAYLDKIGIKSKYYKLIGINKTIYCIIDLHFITNPETDFLTQKTSKRRVMTITSEIEECLESILLKRTGVQKVFSKVFKINPIFR